MRPRPLVLSLACLILCGVPARAAEELKPANTYGVIVGVLKWEKPTLASFSPRHRKDQELYDTLVKRGVPSGNLALLLDEKATLDAIRRALRDVAGRAKPGSTFLFYYAGHGSQGGGKVSFCNYDCGAGTPPKPTLALSEVADILKKHFKGGRVLLMADCCHSGGLKQVADDLAKAKINAASVTSAEASNQSSGNWTFTQAVLDALRGEPLVDADGDGSVTLGELVGEVTAGMKYREGQRSGHAYCGVGADFRMGRSDRARRPAAPPKDGFALGSYVLAPDDGKRRPARVVGFAEGKYAVEFYDYSDKRLARLPAARLEKITYKKYKVGQELQVLWGGKAWKAKVLKAEGDFHLITYLGWGHEWDEWVLSTRVVEGKPGKPVAAAAEVKWQGQWYPAVVLKTEKGKYYIRYVGYDSSWDEWVGKDRIRFPEKK
jgi:hypothetical protein